MQIDFMSKLYIGDKSQKTLLKVIIFLFASIIVVAFLIKIIVGDFKMADIAGFIMPVIIIQVVRGNTKPVPMYANAIGKILFENEKMTITYTNVNDGGRVGTFSEESQICYDEIESIQYSEPLFCFRIVGKGIRVRDYIDAGKKQVLNDGQELTETFVYIFDENIKEEIRKNIVKYSKCFVQVLDN